MSFLRNLLHFEFGDHPGLTQFGERVLAMMRQAWASTQGQAQHYRVASLLDVAQDQIDEASSASGLNIPCRSGCSHCCKSQRILVSENEAKLIFQHVEQRFSAAEKSELMERIAQAKPTDQATNPQRSPCVMLDDLGRCTVHPSRPMTCRSYISISEPQCRKYLQDGQTLPSALSSGGVIWAAYRDVAGPSTLEINGLFQNLYQDPNQQEQWAKDLELPRRSPLSIKLVDSDGKSTQNP